MFSSQPMFVFRMRFVAQSADGSLADLNKGKDVGFGLHLKAGDIVLTWAPKGGRWLFGESGLSAGQTSSFPGSWHEPPGPGGVSPEGDIWR